MVWSKQRRIFVGALQQASGEGRLVGLRTEGFWNLLNFAGDHFVSCVGIDLDTSTLAWRGAGKALTQPRRQQRSI